MPAGLQFYTDSGKQTAAQADLSNAKVAVYEDSIGTKYDVNFYSAYTNLSTNTLATGIADARVFVYTSGTSTYIVDSTSGLAFRHENSVTPANNYSVSTGGSASVVNLMKLIGSGSDAEIVGKLLDVVGNGGKKVLAEKAAEKAVVEAIADHADFAKKVYIKAAESDEVYTKTAADGKFSKPADLTGYLQTANLGTEVIKPVVVNVLVPALATVGSDDDKKVYTKTAADTALALKADTSALATKAEKTEVYTKTDADNAFVKPADLADYLQTANLGTEVVKQPVVDVLVPAITTGAAGVYTKTAADTAFVKTDGSNAGTNPALAKAVLAAKEGEKFLLVNALGTALDTQNTDCGTIYTVQALLGAKGLKGEKAEPEADGATGQAGTGTDATNSAFQDAVKAVVNPPITMGTLADDAIIPDYFANMI